MKISYISTRLFRSRSSDTKWLNKIKRLVELKTGIYWYRKIKATRRVPEIAAYKWKRKSESKRNYEIKEAKELEKNPKGFYQMKEKEKYDQLKHQIESPSF